MIDYFLNEKRFFLQLHLNMSYTGVDIFFLYKSVNTTHKMLNLSNLETCFKMKTSKIALKRNTWMKKYQFTTETIFFQLLS